MGPTTVNGSTALTPEEQCVVDKLRQLPPEAVKQIDEYLLFLETRLANPGTPDPGTPAKTAELLASAAFHRVVRHLLPGEAALILEFATFVAGRSLQWSYDDSASLSLATDLMGLDPFLRREVKAINREFACTEGDGLEPY